MSNVTSQMLSQFEPLNNLSSARLAELASFCFVEQLSDGMELFRLHSASTHLVFLIQGQVQIQQAGVQPALIHAQSLLARRPLAGGAGNFDGKAVGPTQLVRVDKDLLDIMLTWEQLAPENTAQSSSASAPTVPDDWVVMSGVFSVNNLTQGPFAKLPAAHIRNLLSRFERIPVSRGQAVVQEGGDGDYYYVIESGRAQVSRQLGGTTLSLAELRNGDAFGEEALVSDARRNATVTMQSDGVLLRLNKQDFIELLKKPLLNEVSLEQGQAVVGQGAVWIDVRFPSEYQQDRLDGALNIPLRELRNAFNALDTSKQYVLYCQSGRRSSAGAFLLAQRGFKASVLAGGLWAQGIGRQVNAA